MTRYANRVGILPKPPIAQTSRVPAPAPIGGVPDRGAAPPAAPPPAAPPPATSATTTSFGKAAQAGAVTPGTVGGGSAAPAPTPAANPNQVLLERIAKQHAGQFDARGTGAGALDIKPPGAPPAAAVPVDNGATNPPPVTDPPPGSTPDQMWEDIMGQYDESGKRINSMANAYESNASRRASEMAQGSATGGGFAAGMAQAAIGGEQNRAKLGMEHDKQGLEMKMTYLNQLLKQAESTKDRQQAKDIQNMIDKTQMDMAAIDNGLVPSADGSYQTPGAGSTTGPVNVDMNALANPTARTDALKTFEGSTKVNQNMQAQQALDQAPPQVQAAIQGLSGSPETQQAAQRWAYSQFLKTGQWPDRNAIAAALQQGGYLTLGQSETDRGNLWR